MTDMQKTVYVFTQGVNALVALEGMKAANAERERQRYALAYSEEQFINLEKEFCITHNDVISFFTDQ